MSSALSFGAGTKSGHALPRASRAPAGRLEEREGKREGDAKGPRGPAKMIEVQGVVSSFDSGITSCAVSKWGDVSQQNMGTLKPCPWTVASDPWLQECLRHTAAGSHWLIMACQRGGRWGIEIAY